MLFSTGCGAVLYRTLDGSGKLILLLLSFTLIGEICSVFSFHLLGEKAPVYHFTAIVSLYIVTCYFISLSVVRNRKVLLVTIGTVLSVVGLLNCIYFQNIHTLNTNTLRLRCIVVAVLCVLYYYRVFINDSIVSVYNHSHFWITSLLLIIYSFTYFFWSYIVVVYLKSSYGDITQTVQILVNTIAYGSFGIIFLRYPKMIKNDVGQ